VKSDEAVETAPPVGPVMVTPVAAAGVAAATVAVAVPDFVPSWVLVAVMVMVCADDVAAGAVNTPAELIAPAVVDQVTPWDGEFVPFTVAVNC
jgi:hypothetical protein